MKNVNISCSNARLLGSVFPIFVDIMRKAETVKHDSNRRVGCPIRKQMDCREKHHRIHQLMMGINMVTESYENRSART